jgi:hypothetical protein
MILKFFLEVRNPGSGEVLEKDSEEGSGGKKKIVRNYFNWRKFDNRSQFCMRHVPFVWELRLAPRALRLTPYDRRYAMRYLPSVIPQGGM